MAEVEDRAATSVGLTFLVGMPEASADATSGSRRNRTTVSNYLYLTTVFQDNRSSHRGSIITMFAHAVISS